MSMQGTTYDIQHPSIHPDNNKKGEKKGNLTVKPFFLYVTKYQ